MASDISAKLIKSRSVNASADWPAARIVYELRMRGLSLRRLSLEHGYAAQSLWDATRKRSRKAEKIIAQALGIGPEQIWPSRYAQRTRRGDSR